MLRYRSWPSKLLPIKETGNLPSQPRGVPGPVPLTPTDDERRLVAALCKRRVPYVQIAAQIRHGISKKTLQRRFKPELRSAKIGKRPFAPTEAERKLVVALAANGLRYKDIAALVRDGISVPTLTKYFKPELQRGIAETNHKVGETLFKRAIEGDTAALIWWTKARMGWKAAWDGPKDRHPDPEPVGRVERVVVQQTNP